MGRVSRYLTLTNRTDCALSSQLTGGASTFFFDGFLAPKPTGPLLFAIGLTRDPCATPGCHPSILCAAPFELGLCNHKQSIRDIPWLSSCGRDCLCSYTTRVVIDDLLILLSLGRRGLKTQAMCQRHAWESSCG